MIVGLLELKARLEEHALHRGTDRLSLHPKRSRRQGDIMDGTIAPNTDVAGDRTIGIDTSHPRTSFKALERKQFSDDEMACLFRSKLFGRSWQRQYQTHQ